MIYTKMCFFLKTILFFVTHCRIFIGINPEKIAAPAIIFFPCIPHQLNCGFAGLMSCRLINNSAQPPEDNILANLWEKAKSANL